MNKVIISDLDGTLTKIDVLDFLTTQRDKGQNKSIKRKEHEIGEIHLKRRIDRLSGRCVFDIEKTLNVNKENIFKSNYSQFIEYIVHNKIDLIIVSGNIEPVVKFSSKVFNASHYFFTETDISEDGQIIEMKKNGIRKNINIISNYLVEKQLGWNDIIYIGDDMSDIPFWNSTKNSILFGEYKETLCEHVRFKTNGNFLDLITIIESIINEKL